MKKTGILVQILLLVITTTACQNKEKLMEKYEWTATRSAPKNYPMEVVQGDFIFKDGTSLYIPSKGVAANGWGETGPMHVVGDILKPVPEKLTITWLSYTENQFYKGNFDLPTDKISKLFETHFPGIFNNPEEAFNELNVGMAPGGIVVLWMTSAAAQIEVGRFQAEKIDMTMQEFNPDGIQDRDLYVKSTLEEDLSPEFLNELKYNGIDFGTWDVYRDKFNWKTKVNLKSGGTIDYELINLFNGEKETLIGELLKKNEFSKRAVPQYISFYWYDSNKNKFGTRIYFNEKEIMTAYHKIFENKETKQAELTFEVDNYNSNIKIILESENDSIEIKKAEVKVFETTD